MPRRRIPAISVPSRPDSRRGRGNAIDAQRSGRRGRRGQIERIAERRVRAFELRKAGRSYREIARTLACDVHTVYGDVAAELDAARERTVEQAGELRELELQRCDAMTEGLWPGIRAGHPAAVVAGVRVGERRSRLLGLDAPVATKSEISASLSVSETRLKAEKEEIRRWLTHEELQDLAEKSDKLIADAIALAKSRSQKLLSGPPPSSANESGVEANRDECHPPSVGASAPLTPLIESRGLPGSATGGVETE
jgi:hypothetical protein